MRDEEPLDTARIQAALRTRRLGRTLEILPRATSTQTVLKDTAAARPDGAVILAESQSQGRGRMDRRFHSPARAGVYMSLLLRPRLPPAAIPFLTVCAAVATARAIEETAGVGAGIKWVNDVFCAGKKICGILTEASIDAAAQTAGHVVMGIGVNTGPVDPGVAGIATSIETLTGRRNLRNRLVPCLLNHLEPLTDALGADTARREILADYTRRQIILNQTVEVNTFTRVYDAFVLGIDDTGALVVRTAGGAVQHLNAGEVSLKLKG